MTRKSPTKSMFADEDEAVGIEMPVQVSEQPYKPHTDEKEVDLQSSSNFIDLPSMGHLWYPGSVTYRDIMVRDEEILATASPNNYVKTLNSVLKGILNNCEFFDNISVNDRDYLLVHIWANNYSPYKTLEVTCPHCGEKNTHKIDLTKLSVKDIDQNCPVPFKIPLSQHNGDKHVSVRHMTVKDEIAIEEFMARNPKKYTYEFLTQVYTIDTEFPMPLDNKIEFIRDNMTGKEMSYVRQFHTHFRFGVQETVEYKCPACDEVTHGPLPFQAEDVLFPASQDGFEDLLRSNEVS